MSAEQITDAWRKAFKKTADDAIKYAVQVSMRHAQKLTAQNAGIPKFWRGFTKTGGKTIFTAPVSGQKPDSPAQARKQHSKWLSYWIKGIGLPKPPRRGMSGGQFRQFIQNRMENGERNAYFAVAKREQGALAAGFTPAIVGAGKKPVAAYIARHGSRHGSFKVAKNPDKIVAQAKIEDMRGTAGGNKGSLKIFAEAGIRRAQATMLKATEAALQRQIAKISKRYRL